jgi:glycosyl transferase family 25
MAKQLEALNLPYERISAVDGKNMHGEKLFDFALRSRVEEWSKLLTSNMVACSLSHYHIYRKIQDDKVDYALILEDDIDMDNNLGMVLQNIEKVLNKTDVFLIYFHGSQKSFSVHGKKDIINGYAIYKAITVWGAYSSGGYIISKELAAKLANHVFPVHTTPDSWGTFHRDGIIGDLWAVLPLLTSSANFGSDIGYHKLNKIIRKTEKLPVPLVGYIFKRIRRILGKGKSAFKIVNDLPVR